MLVFNLPSFLQIQHQNFVACLLYKLESQLYCRPLDLFLRYFSYLIHFPVSQALPRRFESILYIDSGELFRNVDRWQVRQSHILSRGVGVLLTSRVQANGYHPHRRPSSEVQN